MIMVKYTFSNFFLCFKVHELAALTRATVHFQSFSSSQIETLDPVNRNAPPAPTPITPVLLSTAENWTSVRSSCKCDPAVFALLCLVHVA